MVPTSLDSDVGRVLGGRYRLIAPIGTGASARVFLADDVTLRRRVAVKVLHAALAEDAAFLRRFRAEAQAAASLNNPHVLGVYDWGNDDVPYLVTEYLGGGSLRSILDAHGTITPSQALLVGLEAARGLDYAHGQELVHRDIKPANLLFDDGGRLRIADFGLARAIAEAGMTDEQGSMVGTARYAAPEQARGERVGPPADVYALALVINEAVTGSIPFEGDTAIATLMARTETPFEPHADLGPLQSVLRRAGSLDPDDRPSAGELAASLMSSATDLARPTPLPLVAPIGLVEAGVDATQHGTIHAVGDAAPHVPLEEVAPARRWPWAVLLGIVLVGAAIAGTMAWRDGQPDVGEVPDVAGSSRVEATTVLGDLGWDLVFRDVREDGTVLDEVVSTDPAAGETLEVGEELVIFVSLGEELVTVPDVAELTIEDARDRLLAAGLEVGELIEVENELIASGNVIEAVVPGNAAEVEPGTSIPLMVSGGAAERIIPEVPAGATESDAARLLVDLRLVPAQAMEFSETVPEGEVVRFEPSSGAFVPADSTVVVVISQGPEPREVPAVIGLDVDEATLILQDAGFVVGGVQGDPSLPVLATDPPAGEVHARDTRVVIATQLDG